MTEEHAIQNAIRIELSKRTIVFRANVGKIQTPDGRYFDTGLPVGFSDLFGFRRDGRIFFIEVKAPNGKVSKAQEHFLETVKKYGALSGVARSVSDALKIIEEE